MFHVDHRNLHRCQWLLELDTMHPSVFTELLINFSEISPIPLKIEANFFQGYQEWG